MPGISGRHSFFPPLRHCLSPRCKPCSSLVNANSTKSHTLANVGKLTQIECLSRNHLKWRMWLSAVWVCSPLLPVTCETSCGTRGLMSNVHVFDLGVTTSATMRETKIVLWQSKKPFLFFFSSADQNTVTDVLSEYQIFFGAYRVSSWTADRLTPPVSLWHLTLRDDLLLQGFPQVHAHSLSHAAIGQRHMNRGSAPALDWRFISFEWGKSIWRTLTLSCLLWRLILTSQVTLCARQKHFEL